MGMEAVKDAVMTYQGSASPAVTREEKQPRAEQNGNLAAAAAAVNQTVAPDTEKTDKDGSNKNNAQQQTANQKNKQLQKAVEEINKKMLHNSEAIFGVHEATNRVTIKIVDKDSKKVLKEIPPEETLDMIAKVWELAGIMIDEKM